jgi:hypothetical protein
MALHVVLTRTVVIVIAIAWTVPSTARRTWIHPVVIIIILIDYLIPILWSNGQEVAWFVLPTAWPLNLCPENIATIRRETLTGAFNPPRAGCLQIGAIDLIPKGTVIVPPPLFIWLRVVSNICPIYERKAAHHSRKGELLLQQCGHMSWNCEKWRVMTGSRKIIS